MNAQFSNNISNDQSTNITDQAISGIKTLGDTFSSFFSDALQVNEPISKAILSNDSSQESSIDTMQQSLISSLGLGALLGESGSDSIDNLTSQSSIAALQSTVLSALQASLFSPEMTTTPDVATGNTQENITTSTSEFVDPVGNLTDGIEQFTFGENGLNLNDGFDVLNILHHVPFVSNVYQDISEQTISPMSRLAGGFLYGGALGLAFSAVDLAVEKFSGTTLSESVMQFDYTNIFSNSNKTNNIVKGDNTAPNQPQSGAEYFSLAGK